MSWAFGIPQDQEQWRGCVEVPKEARGGGAQGAAAWPILESQGPGEGAIPFPCVEGQEHLLLQPRLSG